jgi:hypothetical protein
MPPAPKSTGALRLRLDASQEWSGVGGLEVACWPLVPKFAGSHPAEDVGFLRRKKNYKSHLHYK